MTYFLYHNLPPNAPKEIKEVAQAWQRSAVNAAAAIIKEEGQTGAEATATRAFWHCRQCISVEEAGRPDERWIIGDDYERCGNLVHYPSTGAWLWLYPFCDELPLSGGYDEALASAEIIWTG